MKYSEMTEEQRKAYSKDQVERQKKARQMAKQNTVNITVSLLNPSPEAIRMILAVMQEGK